MSYVAWKGLWEIVLSLIVQNRHLENFFRNADSLILPFPPTTPPRDSMSLSEIKGFAFVPSDFEAGGAWNLLWDTILENNQGPTALGTNLVKLQATVVDFTYSYHNATVTLPVSDLYSGLLYLWLPWWRTEVFLT